MKNERVVFAERVFLPERLMESCEDDQELAFEVLEDFRDTSPFRLFRLTEAVASCKPDVVRLEAHSLKGSARTIGAESLAEIAGLLESASANGDLSSASGLLAESQLRLHTLNDALSAFLSFHHS